MMTINGVVQRKLELIAENTRRLRGELPVTSRRLKGDIFYKSGVERILQVSIEAMTDIANRIVAAEGRPPASNSYQALVQLQELGIIDNAENYRNMIRFRNFIVHRYENVDPEIIVGILKNNLSDFDRFVGEIEKNV